METTEEIARKLCRAVYEGLMDRQFVTLYNEEDYWKKNEQYFLDMATSYLKAKELLEKMN
jgi:hypothetical protein